MTAKQRQKMMDGMDAIEAWLEDQRNAVQALRAAVGGVGGDDKLDSTRAAQYLGISTKTLYRAMDAGDLPKRRKSRSANGHFVFTRSELDQYAQKRARGGY